MRFKVIRSDEHGRDVRYDCGHVVYAGHGVTDEFLGRGCRECEEEYLHDPACRGCDVCDASSKMLVNAFSSLDQQIDRRNKP